MLQHAGTAAAGGDPHPGPGGRQVLAALGSSGITERNPFLGLRSVRLCLRNLTLFKTQMRAILRASAFGDVRIMFPMISTLLELRQCKMILAEVKEDLEEEGIAFNPQSAGRHHDRSAVGGDHGRTAGPRGGFLFHRHQRSGSIYAWRPIATTKRWPRCTIRATRPCCG